MTIFDQASALEDKIGSLVALRVPLVDAINKSHSRFPHWSASKSTSTPPLRRKLYNSRSAEIQSSSLSERLWALDLQSMPSSKILSANPTERP